MRLEEAIILRDRLARRGVPQPDILGPVKTVQPGPEPPMAAQTPATGKITGSKIERKFLALWQALGGPPLKREYRFHPVQKWRADFAYLPRRVLIELDGAVWGTAGGQRGGHDGAGRIRDCRKAFEAWLLGWTTIRLVPDQITAENLRQIIGKLK